jgi:hypothetical protein
MARVIRQFEAPHELVTLEKVTALPALPTMGAAIVGAQSPWLHARFRPLSSPYILRRIFRRALLPDLWPLHLAEGVG